ncbi:NUDIX domain [Vibrio sp. B1FLJ16]|uniref:NUDIX hydrolase n=1 Tax=Vibrio sp. B1FLJ16 TaxID=2751178 RepID=UPI0015F6E750|nr:NUDIX hydrolase [Vibrio sp. B1FLJ16]CAD7798555.1 NUDIX domain [Vibrio sp. B1FLJ16]CAE6883088.1 NUDIX domain [Vibrio sp. B1FLJ16]
MYKGDYKKGEIEIEKENIVFQNNYATLYNDDVIFPSGSKGKYLRFEWNSPYGVMVFPRDNQGRILLVKNFRHENRSWSWEIPKGFGEKNLTPIECAQKELLEETGCIGKNWKLIKTIPDKSSKGYVFMTEVDSSTTIANQELSEAISEVSFFERSELLSLLKDDMISDPMTMFFISYCLANIDTDV